MSDIPLQWPRRAGTPEEFERDRLERTAMAINLPFEKVVQKFGQRPFGNLTEMWHRFIQQLEESDELWFFSSPEDTFAKKLGCMGYAIVREGVIRDTLITLET